METFEVPMEENDAGAKTIGEYLIELGKTAKDEKRPFGNSGWYHELAAAFYEAGMLEVTKNEWDELEFNYREVDALIDKTFDDILKAINDRD